MIVIAAAGAAVALFLLVSLLFGSDRAVERDLRGRLGSLAAPVEEHSFLGKFRIIRRFATQAEDMAAERGMLGALESALAQANLPLRPGEAIAGAIGLAIVSGLLAGLFTQSTITGLVIGVLTLAILGMAVNTVASRERKRFEAQLPDTLNLISTSLRAGYSMLQSVEAVANEASEPTGREFKRAINETRLGRSPVDALKDVAERMGSQDFDWAVLAISIQREVGGNLAEVLQTAADTMLQRNRLRREMKALTAEGRISAIVLGALPFFLFGFLFTTNRSYLQPMLDNTIGRIAMGGVLLLITAGIVWLNKIVTVEV
jgi:tight adherence protein B